MSKEDKILESLVMAPLNQKLPWFKPSKVPDEYHQDIENDFDNEKPAIVFAEMVLVKSEPQNGSNTVFTLHEGTKVFVKETVENWRKIQLTDGTEGWIEKTAIKEVKK